jgi:exosortase
VEQGSFVTRTGRLLDRPLWRSPVVLFGTLGAVALWCYWPTLVALARTWWTNPQYSHGYLVPVFAAVLLWSRRRLAPAAVRTNWWGLPVLLAGQVMRLAGMFFFYDWFEAVSLLPSLASVCLLLGGWPALRWAWPAVGFLAFMIPLPYQVESALAQPLQRVATVMSTYALQTLGLPALSQGNVIVLGDLRLGVLEACSGLSMLVVFFALSFAVALVIRRPLWQKALLVASAVPVALVANVLRITGTGVLYEMAGGGVAEVFYHDLAGWLMMPLALGILWLELLFLGRLFVRPAPTSPLPLGGAGSAARPREGVAACGRDRAPAAARALSRSPAPTLPRR